LSILIFKAPVTANYAIAPARVQFVQTIPVQTVNEVLSLLSTEFCTRLLKFSPAINHSLVAQVLRAAEQPYTTSEDEKEKRKSRIALPL
jgi:hypothetical protein